MILNEVEKMAYKLWQILDELKTPESKWLKLAARVDSIDVFRERMDEGISAL